MLIMEKRKKKLKIIGSNYPPPSSAKTCTVISLRLAIIYVS